MGEDDETARALAKAWRAEFIREFGTEHCATLRNAQVQIPEYRTMCGALIVRSARMLAELLDGQAKPVTLGRGVGSP